jgi:hypothetical protein
MTEGVGPLRPVRTPPRGEREPANPPTLPLCVALPGYRGAAARSNGFAKTAYSDLSPFRRTSYTAVQNGRF